MLSKSKGIVFRTIRYDDKKLIVKIYTDLHGLQSFFVSTGKSPRSKIKTALLQPLTQLELETTQRVNKQFAKIQDIRCSYHYTDIHLNIYKNTICAFLNEVLYQSVKEEEANENLFDFISAAFQWLDQSRENISNFHLYFLIELSKHMGFYPQNNYTNEHPWFDLYEGAFVEKIPMHASYLGPESSILLSDLLMVDLRNIRYYNISKAERDDILQNLLQFYRLHVAGLHEIRSLAVLRETFA
ncbi:MAG: recombination protein RecO [Bacteroidetes bacterium]|jgi:DNA repair protein RecO (recombination protein O)|nr:recombination protein RecO [Bacteroidota bacterium]